MRVHEELLAPSMGLAPDGASVPLFKIVPNDFVEPVHNAGMPSAVGFKKAAKILQHFMLQKGNTLHLKLKHRVWVVEDNNVISIRHYWKLGLDFRFHKESLIISRRTPYVSSFPSGNNF